MPRPPDQSTLDELKAAVGPAGWLQASTDVTPYTIDFRRLYHGVTPLVLLPRDTAQVASLLAICNREGIGVVPQGGNTSYCGAATPDESGSQVVMSLSRMKQVRRVDAANNSMVVEAGITLAAAQAAAAAADRLFPLSLGSEGTAQIGGNLSTNAGGTAVLRYGMMRDLVFGLEVVLADGRIFNGLHGLRKDNTGYDVKSLFIGAEGTLGIITAASLKLFALPGDTATALLSVDSPQKALDVLAVLRSAAGDALTACELLPRRAVELTVEHIPGVSNPLSDDASWYLLLELSASGKHADLATLLVEELARATELDLLRGALIAASGSQSASMWKLRESVPEAQRHHGPSLKHDIAVPVSAIPSLLERGAELVRRLVPEGELIAYGHMGDGNLHFNVGARRGCDVAAFMAQGQELEHAIFDLVDHLEGSISAEHGIGRLKIEAFAKRADPVEFAVMRELKRTLDPRGIMNPGKVLASIPSSCTP